MATSTERQPETKEEKIAREKKEARFAELRSRVEKSAIFAECKDRSIATRWVRKDDPTDIANHERMGFKIVREPNPKAPLSERRFDTTIPCNAEGIYVYGDVILMEIPRDDYDFYVNEGVELSKRRLESGKARFLATTKRQGMRSVHVDDAGRMTVSDDL